MPVQRRAYIIGLIGPAIQAIGLVWEALHVLIAHWSVPLSARHLMYEPGVLLIVVGFIVSVVCVPVAIEVAQANERDVEIPVYEPEPQGGRAAAHGYSGSGRGHAG
jgi:hypothetical protein